MENQAYHRDRHRRQLHRPRVRRPTKKTRPHGAARRIVKPAYSTHARTKYLIRLHIPRPM